MRNSKQSLKRLAIALGALLLLSSFAFSQVTVGITPVTVKIGTTLSIPINVGDLTGKGVISYQYTLTYDPTKISVTGVTGGPLVAGWAAPTVNTSVSGQVTVAGAGSSVLSGKGILSYLAVTTTGKGSSALTLSPFAFNEGLVAVTVTNGLVTVPQLSVKLGDVTSILGPGGAITVPITTEDLTGLGAKSYQFIVKFDTTVVKLTGASITGTMSAAMANPTVNATVSGQLSVAAAGATDLTGAGTLLNLTGVTVANPPAQSVLTFSAFQYNDGTPAGGGVNGSVIIGVNQKPVFVSRTPSAPVTIAKGVSTKFIVSARDPEGFALTYTWKVNGAQVQTGSDSTYTATFTDPHGTAKIVTAVFTDIGGLKDSTVWNFTVTGINNNGGIPTDFVLGQNYPNPFNPMTLISFSLPKEAPVTFEIYNLLGVKVRTLMAGETRSAGTYQYTWDGKNDSGVGMPSGVYLYRVAAGQYVASKKMTLLK